MSEGVQLPIRLLATLYKQPDELRILPLVYTDLLGDGEIVTALIAAVATLISGSGILTLGTEAIVENGTQINIPVSGGVSGSTYKISAAAQLSGGGQPEADVLVEVLEL